MSKVRKIEPIAKLPETVIKPKITRVAVYARVSTDMEEQASSFEAQKDYYEKKVRENKDWTLVGIYADEGKTGTSYINRTEFLRMMEDCRLGKIDMILTKSVSRFARNTVDALKKIRELKARNIGVFFERENIWTLDAKGEFLITLLTSLAQEESRSISENTTWGKRKAFADGRYSVAYTRFLGYDRGAKKGGFVINEGQARIVRLIYRMYLQGYSPYRISEFLTRWEVRTPTGSGKWHSSSVISILQNEKYKGDALLQKCFTKDFLTHKRVQNNGEVPQYYVENHHEGIVTAEQFEQVQLEMQRRLSIKGYSAKGEFSSIIRCGDCGGWYGSKVWHSNDKYRRIVFQCNHKYSKKYRCKTPHLYEEQLEEMFIKAANTLFGNKDEILANVKDMMLMVCGIEAMTKEVEECIDEMNSLSDKMQAAIAENSRTALNQDDYDRRYKAYAEKYETLKDRYLELNEEIERRKAKKHQFTLFIEGLEKQDGLLTEFDRDIWNSLLEEILVKAKDDVTFVFRGGYEVKV